MNTISHLMTNITDWDDSKTHLADLKGTAPGAAKSAGDKLWEDNWDDDDIEDDFWTTKPFSAPPPCPHDLPLSLGSN